MARAVDLDKAIEIIEGKQKELCPVGRYGRNYVYGSDREKYDAWEEIIDALENLPTLTPPNEPLTWNELDNMIAKPVYIVELEDGESCWVLVHTVDDIKALFVSAFDQYDYGNRELYGQTWLAYRRPKEEQ